MYVCCLSSLFFPAAPQHAQPGIPVAAPAWPCPAEDSRRSTIPGPFHHGPFHLGPFHLGPGSDRRRSARNLLVAAPRSKVKRPSSRLGPQLIHRGYVSSLPGYAEATTAMKTPIPRLPS
ncbi:hypothetical protein CDD80_3819 [Ophiocordyceps camponoti-rufipedis]|uniref:Uncharacterized protein n=1 Tax=Ophiocordyceps camponoti-rufipedis TaxID=2004952 RepID=A0A2C5Y5S8_9HYPO|nr:hypothetical protein CDD80_3819 [Ophiocordyceps camponoti-rufipedis]